MKTYYAIIGNTNEVIEVGDFVSYQDADNYTWLSNDYITHGESYMVIAKDQIQDLIKKLHKEIFVPTYDYLEYEAGIKRMKEKLKNEIDNLPTNYKPLI